MDGVGFREERRVPDLNFVRNSYPKTLDIIRINSRWAQISAGIIEEDHTYPILVRYLDDQSCEQIFLNRYRIKKRYGYDVGFALRLARVQFTEEEIANIHWGDEQLDHPYLKLEVILYGEFEKN